MEETTMINKNFLRKKLGKEFEIFFYNIINNTVEVDNEDICLLTQEQVSNLSQTSPWVYKKIFSKLIKSNLIKNME